MVATPRVDGGNEPLAVPVRRWWTRLSSAHILIFAAGVLAFIANLAVLRPGTDPPLVAVAASDLLPGTVFDSTVHAEFVPLTAEPDVLAHLVTRQHRSLADGSIVTGRVPQGSPVVLAALVEATVSPGSRLMSIPIDRDRAAGGQLVAGDLVDVIASEGGQARFVATSLEVVAVPEARSGSFSGSTGYHVVVAVDPDSSLALAAALTGSNLHLIRATGAAPVAAEPGASDG